MQAAEAPIQPVVAAPEPTGAAKMVETMKELSNTFKDAVDNLAHNVPEPVSKVLHPITAALHPHSVAPVPAPAGADTEVHIDEVDQVSILLSASAPSNLAAHAFAKSDGGDAVKHAATRT